MIGGNAASSHRECRPNIFSFTIVFLTVSKYEKEIMPHSISTEKSSFQERLIIFDGTSHCGRRIKKYIQCTAALGSKHISETELCSLQYIYLECYRSVVHRL